MLKVQLTAGQSLRRTSGGKADSQAIWFRQSGSDFRQSGSDFRQSGSYFRQSGSYGFGSQAAWS